MVWFIRKNVQLKHQYILLQIRIGEKSLEKTLVVGYDFGSGFGLLGHNALVNFQLFVDWRQKMVELHATRHDA